MLKKFKLISAFTLFILFSFTTSSAKTRFNKQINPYTNTKLSPIRCINSHTYKISFTSSKILLEKDVKKSIINLKKNKTTLKANFYSLSDNGKKITYKLDKNSIKAANPGDGSMNGKFNISFSFCNHKTIIMYTERIIKNSITGFILSSDGHTISKASISIKTKNKKKYTCKSDDNGQYILPIPETTSGDITVQKSGYISQTIKDVKTNNNSALCENFILNDDTSSPATSVFYITDMLGNNISNASIDIIDNDKIIFHTSSDNNGYCVISNTKTPVFSSLFTKINISNDFKEITCTNNSTLMLPSHIDTFHLNKKNNYKFCISKSSSDNTISYSPVQFTFSFNDIYTDNAMFNIKLNNASFKKNSIPLSIKLDSENIIKNISLLSIELYSLNESDSISKPVFKNTYSIPEELKSKTLLSFDELTNYSLTKNPILLCDGLYYFKIQAYDNKDLIIGGPCIKPLKILNNTFEKTTIAIQDNISKNLIAYINFSDNYNTNYTNEFNSNISFLLCENKDDLIIPVAPVYFEKCSFSYKNNSSYAIANLSLSNLSPNSNYIIYPYSLDSKLTISSQISFSTIGSTSTDNIECASPKYINNKDILSNIYQQNLNLLTKLFPVISIDNNEIRASKNYLNSIICIYDNNYFISSVSCINTSMAGYISLQDTPFEIYTNNNYISITS